MKWRHRQRAVSFVIPATCPLEITRKYPEELYPHRTGSAAEPNTAILLMDWRLFLYDC